MSNTDNAQKKDKKDPDKTSKVKYKLHITLIFADETKGEQQELAKKIRKELGNNENKLKREDIANLNMATLFLGGNFKYEDTDKGYEIKKKEFSISENSPKCMAQTSEDINEYILEWCDNGNVSEVCVNILVPSYSENPVVPRAFFNSYPIKCLQSDYKNEKLNREKSNIILYGFDTCRGLNNSDTSSPNKTNNTTTNIVKLSALISYYVYYFLDCLECRDSTSVKWDEKDLINKENITEYVNKQLKGPTESNKTTDEGFFKRLWSTVSSFIGVPFSAISAALDFFFFYSKHVKDRIYGRIFDVLRIVNPKEALEGYVEKIIAHLTKAKDEPLGLYEFFQECGYWEYLEGGKNSGTLSIECKKWTRDIAAKFEKDNKTKRIFNVYRDQSSGFGAALFHDRKDKEFGKNYIYAFKGTDMDSYGKDWLMTNLLQGLTGFSRQHHEAHVTSQKINKYLKNVGANLWFTGHSLGGGLASVATLANIDRRGITFNAAGLNINNVKIAEFTHNIPPSEGRNRVQAFIIKGEVLDRVQTVTQYAVPILKRAYGHQPIEIAPYDDKLPCVARHGINNFLYKEVMNELTLSNKRKETDKSNTNITSATFVSRDVTMTATF